MAEQKTSTARLIGNLFYNGYFHSNYPGILNAFSGLKGEVLKVELTIPFCHIEEDKEAFYYDNTARPIIADGYNETSGYFEYRTNNGKPYLHRNLALSSLEENLTLLTQPFSKLPTKQCAALGATDYNADGYLNTFTITAEQLSTNAKKAEYWCDKTLYIGVYTYKNFIWGDDRTHTGIKLTYQLNNTIYYATAGEWVECVPYYGVNGEWKEVEVSFGLNNEWVR